jgi:hypothetical protein
VAVHYIDMNLVGAAARRRGDLRAQCREVRRKD